ncbi:hypothetical protein [Pseudomonas sp. BCRC 81390]|uniref:hypothetical protein n=1 Tax=Pseudomonas sp. BCRC 81390 TaxID=3054778 RepID=UPI00338FE5D6
MLRPNARQCINSQRSSHHAFPKTRDAEGGLWRYDYDQRGNIIEAIRVSVFSQR